MIEHELRNLLSSELHERAGLPITAPCSIVHLGFTIAEDDPAPTDAVISLAHHFRQKGPQPGTLHLLLNLDGGVLRYERHREFYRLAIVRTDAKGTDNDPLALLPKEWLESLPGKRLIAIRTRVLSRRQRRPGEKFLQDYFGHQDLAGATVSHGQAFVWTDFRIGPDGFTRILIQDRALSPFRLGRVVRRMHEIETYRMMALLGLPLARHARQKIGGLELQLAALARDIAQTTAAKPDDSLLAQLIAVSAETADLSNQTSFRFAATKAYAELVTRRVAEMAEKRDGNYQRIGLFLERRFAPAVATCASTSEQLQELALRSERASNLLRTRVDITLEQQNQKLLESMEKRTHQQLRLQEAVEGLSVVAISYYAVQLVLKFYDSIEAWLHIELPHAAPLVVIPAVVLACWLYLRRLRARYR